MSITELGHGYYKVAPKTGKPYTLHARHYREAQELAGDIEYYRTAEHLTAKERRDAVAWCRAGCPGDEPTDVGSPEDAWDFC